MLDGSDSKRVDLDTALQLKIRQVESVGETPVGNGSDFPNKTPYGSFVHRIGVENAPGATSALSVNPDSDLQGLKPQSPR